MTLAHNNGKLASPASSPAHARRASSIILREDSRTPHHRLCFLHDRSSMAPTKLTDRPEPLVVPRSHAPVRSRLPPVLRIPILVVLNLGINVALWSAASNFLNPELGQISKVPREDDVVSFYSPGARVAMRVLTTWMTWYFSYDCTKDFYALNKHITDHNSLRCHCAYCAYTSTVCLPFEHLLQHLDPYRRSAHGHRSPVVCDTNIPLAPSQHHSQTKCAFAQPLPYQQRTGPGL